MGPLEEAGLCERIGDVWQLSPEALQTLGRGTPRATARPNPTQPRVMPTTPTPINQKAEANRSQKRQTVLEIARTLGSVANRDVRLALGLNLSQASHLLRTMQQAGLLSKIGESPRETRYTIV